MKKSFKQKLLADEPEGYVFLRKSEYPSLEDQLDALYKARRGDDSELKKLDRKITRVKNKYPKPE